MTKLKVNEVLANGIKDMMPRIQNNPDNVARSHEMHVRKENIRSKEAVEAVDMFLAIKEQEDDFKVKTILRQMDESTDGAEYFNGLKVGITIDKNTDFDGLLKFLEGYGK